MQLTDTERLDILDALTARHAYQNKRRPSEQVNSDMHFGALGVSIYARRLTGQVDASGHGTTAREAIDRIAEQLRSNTQGKPTAEGSSA